MSLEGQRPPQIEGEQPIDPITRARQVYGNALFADQPNGLVRGIVGLENAMLQTKNPDDTAERTYSFLSGAVQLGIQRAQMLEGNESETAGVLQGFHERYSLVLQSVTSTTEQAGAQNQPTVTVNLPPMTGAKGEQLITPAVPIPKPTGEVATPTQSEITTAPKKRGRPRKDPSTSTT
jgi:hypothetical protein